MCEDLWLLTLVGLNSEDRCSTLQLLFANHSVSVYTSDLLEGIKHLHLPQFDNREISSHKFVNYNWRLLLARFGHLDRNY